MLQQTQVDRVIPYYERFLARFSTVQALADAPLSDVLKMWEGLGYYSRARNLHRAAKVIVNEYGGEIPSEPEILLGLPGIGRYSAGAIASIAFGKDAAALDGNIRRVLARVYNVRLPARSNEGERFLWQLAWDNLPPGQAGAYNQALMELGALVCTPRRPNCPECPLNLICRAAALGVQEELPVKIPQAEIPHYVVTAAVIWRDGQVLIAQRPQAGLLGGMWEFPGGKVEPGENLVDCLQREIREELDAEVEVGEPLGIYEHAYSHFRVTLHAFLCRLNGGEPQPIQPQALLWIPPTNLKDYPMGKIDRAIAGRVDEMMSDR